MKVRKSCKPLAAIAVLGGATMLGSVLWAAPAANHSHREHHPELRRALDSLEKSKKELANSAHDFGGHRVKALQLTDSAIAEVHEALKFDK